MTHSSWNELLQDLQNPNDIRLAIKAGRALSKMAKASNVPDLYALLQHESFFVREEVARPLARLEGAKALPALFQALNRGEQDGHDNDDLITTMIELFESHKREVAQLLLVMLKSDHASTRADAAWALSFVVPEVSAQPLFDLLSHDPDPEVRSVAAGSLQIFQDPAFRAVQDPVHTLDTFNGQWMWLDCEPSLKYGVEINGMTGICLKANSPNFSIGDVILKISLFSGQIFVGQHLFTNAAWYPVTGWLEGSFLYLQGGNQIWQLQRIDHSQ